MQKTAFSSPFKVDYVYKKIRYTSEVESQVREYIPLCYSNLTQSIFAKTVDSKLPKYKIETSSDLHKYTKKTLINDTATDTFKHKLIHTPKQTVWASRAHKFQDGWKVFISTTDKYTTFQYGIGLDNDALTNEYLSNDTLFGHFNASTVMAYDDGTAELVRGVGDNGSIGAVKYFLPVSDTLTDIQLFFARTPENLSQTISFALLVYERIDTATNFPGANDLPLVRKQFILPPTDSVNKMITFSLRDENSLTKRILPGNKDFYIGWQQGLIDTGNEVRVGCDINSSNPGTFFFKSGQSWRQWGFDKFPLMIRPVFGPEFVTSVKSAISKPQSPFFPNPARTEIRNLRDFTSFQIFNMMGQLIDSCPSGRAGEALPIHLPAGIYTLKWMETGGHPVSQRLVVE
jgi:hypothetical protein